jgi:hypothetical protein
MIIHDFDLRPSRFAVRQQLEKHYGNAEYRHSLNTCNMPFAAVVAAAGVIGTAATVGVAAAGGALAVAGAAITVVAAAATVAGLVMTVVGAVTGDKELMKIGAIVGLAGGIAGIAGGAISGSAAAAAETAASEGAKVAVGEVAAKGATTTIPQMSSTVANMSPAAVGAGNSMGGVIPSTALGSSGNALSSGILSGAAQGVAPVNLATVGAGAGATGGGYGWMGDLVGLGSDTGASVGVTSGLKDAATTAVDAGMSTRDMIGIAGMGATAISTYQQGEAANKAALARNQIDINTYNANQARLDREYKNSNTQANFSMNVANPTPEQLAANNKAKLVTPTIAL